MKQRLEATMTNATYNRKPTGGIRSFAGGGKRRGNELHRCGRKAAAHRFGYVRRCGTAFRFAGAARTGEVRIEGRLVVSEGCYSGELNTIYLYPISQHARVPSFQDVVGAEPISRLAASY